VLIGSRKKQFVFIERRSFVRSDVDHRHRCALLRISATVTLGKIYCQANPDGTTPDDQDLGVDATGHERTVKTISTADIDTIG
jgi:hypothetical protein